MIKITVGSKYESRDGVVVTVSNITKNPITGRPVVEFTHTKLSDSRGWGERGLDGWLLQSRFVREYVAL